uniref:Beclin-1-like protein A n=1 Tax=Dermatophagoides pteronyssinus TaxID=6956 RepID=A0A6P6YKA6_DERPT|nr:beclin-1-like protein A [Dermatophagoides pteronyssinus]
MVNNQSLNSQLTIAAAAAAAAAAASACSPNFQETFFHLNDDDKPNLIKSYGHIDVDNNNNDDNNNNNPGQRFCSECNIQFMSIKTYKVHKELYCSSRHHLITQQQSIGSSSSLINQQSNLNNSNSNQQQQSNMTYSGGNNNSTTNEIISDECNKYTDFHSLFPGLLPIGNQSTSSSSTSSTTVVPINGMAQQINKSIHNTTPIYIFNNNI